MEMKWCAVTGGRGFMARYLVEMLLRSGEWRVRVADLAPAVALDRAEEAGLLGTALRDGRATYVSVNVSDLAQLAKAFEGVEVVFHTAAPDPGKNSSRLQYSVNVEGTKFVIDACIMNKVKRLIYTSSSSVVFDGVHAFFDANESMPYPDKFVDAYTKTKAEAEKLVLRANGTGGLLTCCIRPTTIFGPGGRNIPILVKGSRIGKFNFIVGNGKNYDDYVYVENVAYSHICAEKTLATEEGAKTTGGQTYFITNMEPVNMWDFISLIKKGLGYNSQFTIKVHPFVIMPTAYTIHWIYKLFSFYEVRPSPTVTPTRVKFAILNRTHSCKKAIDQLGYKPIVSLKDGLKRTIESYPHPRAKKLP